MKRNRFLQSGLKLFLLGVFSANFLYFGEPPHGFPSWILSSADAQQKRVWTETDLGHPPQVKRARTIAGFSLGAHLREITPKGWKLYGNIEEYTPDTLYLQIDGQAELYRTYDVVSATFVNYVSRLNNMHFVEASIYEMGNPENAFGIFSVQRQPEAIPLGLGRDSARADGCYDIWKGPYYVRIIVSDNTDPLHSIGIALACRITEFLNDDGEPIWGLDTLPKKDQIPGSVRYFRRNAMGLGFMTDTYLARYRKGGKQVAFFLSQRKGLLAAGNTFSEYGKFAEQFGDGTEHHPLNGSQMMVCDMGDWYDVIFLKGRLIGGVSSVEDRHLAVRIATELWRQIPQPD